MGFSLKGDYFEACNCSITCRCVFGTPFDGEACDAFFSWHIEHGEKEGVDLSGLNMVMARHRPRDLTKDSWFVELYVDERAGPEQAKALEAIFSGKAGGYIATIFQRIGKVTGIRTTKISFEKTGRKRGLRVGETLEVQGQELVGMDGKNPCVIDNPTVWAMVAQPMRQGKADTILYKGPWKFETNNSNSFVTEFKYEG
jgi:hypothetical protein